jgi:adhesin HecA-like repeat protein
MPGGVLRGDVRVATLLAAGLLDGRIQAGRAVEVSSHGELRGEIVSPSIDVQAGARISGASLRVGATQVSQENF